VNLPSASALAALRGVEARRKRPDKLVAVLADPVFDRDDPRIPSVPLRRTSRAKSKALPIGLERSAGEGGAASKGSPLFRLPFTRREAQAILEFAPPGQRLRAFDFRASRAAATSDELRRYRFVHFATHGFLNSQHPELSGVVFSLINERGETQDGFL